jgi:hypothetical protein
MSDAHHNNPDTEPADMGEPNTQYLDPRAVEDAIKSIHEWAEQRGQALTGTQMSYYVLRFARIKMQEMKKQKELVEIKTMLDDIFAKEISKEDVDGGKF